jgi:hypothetical protein
MTEAFPVGLSAVFELRYIDSLFFSCFLLVPEFLDTDFGNTRTDVMRLILFLALAIIGLAENVSVVSLFIPDTDPQSLVASVIALVSQITMVLGTQCEVWEKLIW